jgi:serine/threonine protein kinase/WD40 repeat protein
MPGSVINFTEETLFAAALEKGTPADRMAFLDRACAGDAPLRRRVEALLESHEHTNFLVTPAIQQAAKAHGADPTAADRVLTEPEAPDPAIASNQSASMPGANNGSDCYESLGAIGPYKLFEKIGEGGMGTVYLAEQEHPVRRRVALKLIKAGMRTHQVTSRFETERQALALMDHPNIARVLDAGATDKGRPYFVMELVKGMPITRYCDERQLTPRERLKLFIPVCQAVQHAHQKGIIHRDLKPSNVLMALYDGEPVPKVIDFGVAKATGPRLTDHTFYTELGSIIGTLEYMSPEQAELNQLDVDTRSDIYSLGVLLYELLTGTTPLEHEHRESAKLLDVLRIIREEDPPRPSTRLSATQELASIAARRGVEPRRLRGIVRGELDWIVMKALEKDRTRRYETASGLVSDLQKYLADEPVSACPPSAWYRSCRLARRNKAALGMACVIAGALLATIVALAVSNRRVYEKQLQTTKALEQTRLEKRQKSEQLWQALVAEARANRLSRRAGQRFETLEILGQATELGRTLRLPDAKIHDLRNDVIATLALPDLHLTELPNPWPASARSLDFDERQTIYARIERDEGCSIRRLVDDVEIYRLRGLGTPLLSRDGKFIAVADRDAERKDTLAVQVWQLDGASPRRLLSETKVNWVDFHKNGRQAALVYTDGSIRLFELPSGRQQSRLAPHTLVREVKCALHPTEPIVAVCSYFGSVAQIRDVRTGDVLSSLPVGGPGAIAWHPDGRMLAVGSTDGGLTYLYDRSTLRPFRTLETPYVTSVAFNHAGDRLASTGWGTSAELFDVGTGQKLFATKPMVRRTLRFSPDDRRLAGAVQDGKLGIWHVGDGREFRTFIHNGLSQKCQYLSVTVSPSGRLLVAATTDGFGFWDLAGGSEVAFISMPGHHNQVLFEPTGAVLTLTETGVLRWPVRLESPSADHLVVGPPEPLPLPPGNSLGLSGDGRVIASCSRAAGAPHTYAGGWILHADRPGPPIRIDAGADVAFIAVSPDGRWVVTAAHEAGPIKIWDARDGRLVKQLADQENAYPAFSHDGRWLCIGGRGGELFAVGDWEPGPRVGGSGTFAPDGKLFAIASGAGTIRLVDPADGRELATLSDPNQVACLAPIFTLDGTKLIASSPSNGIHVWDLRLIRRQLADMGLDWDTPPYQQADIENGRAVPLSVEVRLGDRVLIALSSEERARQAINQYRLALKSKPECANTCNSLAWAYLTAPEALRDVKAALPLAEKAVRLMPGDAAYANTLAVAYYRDGRYRAAIDILKPNLARHRDWALAFDLYCLAMSYHRLGETIRAQVYYDWAVCWTAAQTGLSSGHAEDLKMLHAEAEELLKQEPDASKAESQGMHKPE